MGARLRDGGVLKALVGAALVAVHAALFALCAARCRGTELSVDLAAAPREAVPAALRARVIVDEPPPGPGLARRRWAMHYRGGIERAIGAAALVGPFQDPAAPACSGRIIIGQRLLDDGHAGAGTIAAEMRRALDAELRGESFFPVGDYVRLDHLSLTWSQLAQHPGDARLVGDAPRGYVRGTATIVFSRVSVPMAVALVPVAAPGELRFRIAAHADLAFDNRALQWISDKLGGDKLATRFARRQIDGSLLTALAPPPPLALPDGTTLRFVYCDEPAEIVDGAYGALPFGVAIGRGAVLPPRLGRGPRTAPSTDTRVALDLDLDALNALLYELWRGGTLDRTLAAAALEQKFDADPIVQQYLTLRVPGPPRLALPPVLTAAGARLELRADARVDLVDRGATTRGRVWGRVQFELGGARLAPLRAAFQPLELSCERSATVLVPCYGDLVAAMNTRVSELDGAIADSLAGLLSDLFVERRLGGAGLPADLVIHAASPALATSGNNATLRLDLDAALAPAR